MSTDELSRDTPRTDDHLAAVQESRARGIRPEPFDKLRTAPVEGRATTGSALKGLVPLALLTMIFIGYTVPPYLTLDAAQARIQPMPPHASYYALLVTHIFLGSVALLAACLQVWPWLRRSRPAIHRLSGRVYVGAALSASICAMIISPMGLHGANQRVSNTMLALLWFGTTLAGFRAIRQRRFADHRRWMLRSVALVFSIVAFRVWMFVIFAVFVPETFTGGEVDPAALDQAIGLSSWVSWVVNLLIVEWWLHRRPGIPA
jgi:uncharacterized membrane protein